ncbi:MAG: M17 family peptidase N-terminal domain-containing protein, partial [Lysobacteraceae bacterium]
MPNHRLSSAPVASLSVDCVIAAVFEDGSLSAAANALDHAANGRLRALIAAGDVSGKAGRHALLHGVDGISAPRLLLLGAGAPGALDAGRYAKLANDAIKALKNTPVKHAHTTLPTLEVSGHDAAWRLRQSVLAAEHAA